MTIIFDYLFTQTKTGFVCRVPVQFPGVKTPLQAGENTDAIEAAGTDLYQWVGKRMHVTIINGIHTVSGLAD